MSLGPNPVHLLIPSPLRLWGRAFRVHQWVKNVLIFVPLVLAGMIASFEEVKQVLAGFALLCLTASATYILNDLMDLQHDRIHPTKKKRPFACGDLSAVSGVVAVCALSAIVTFYAQSMSLQFLYVLGAYVALTLSYSLLLKRKAIIDVLAVAILFTLRIAAGMTLLPSPTSYWLLLFSFFFFLSLALVKRYAELHDLAAAKGHKVSGRIYAVTDMPFIMSTGLASTFAGCLVFVIYIANEHFPHNIYSAPQWLWAICGILVYWLVRIWFLASRGAMNQDPILFAITDKASLAMGALTLGCVALAW